MVAVVDHFCPRFRSENGKNKIRARPKELKPLKKDRTRFLLGQLMVVIWCRNESTVAVAQLPSLDDVMELEGRGFPAYGVGSVSESLVS